MRLVAAGILLGSLLGFAEMPALASDGAVAASSSPLPILCRDSWRARPPLDGLVKHTIQKITIHHTATKFTNNRRTAKALRNIQTWHQRHPRKKLPDIAYHYVIDRNGFVVEARDSAFRGDTHTRYDPTGHLLICLLGNFEEQKPSEAQRRALVELVSWATRHHEVPVDAIGSHRDHAKTLCPGKNLHQWVQSGGLVSAVQERLEEGAVKRRVICGDTAREWIRQIERSKRFTPEDALQLAPQGE